MTTEFDVLIVGAGIVGLTAAIAMQQRGFRVGIVDAGDFTVQTNNRVYAINEASKQLFKRLGIWDLLDQEQISPYKKMQVWDAKSGASIDFDARLMASAQLGVILEEEQIKKALMLALDNIQLIPNSTIDKVNAQSTGMEILSAGQCWQSKLLMIADGAHSATRKSLKVVMTEWSYHQQAIVASVQTELSHQQSAYQIFHPEGPLAFLPLANPQHCSIVWTTTPKQAEYLMSLKDEAFNQELANAFESTLGKTTLLSKRQSFPLTMRHTKQYSAKHWLLLGDAAHTIHPLAGLGLNLGLADLASWLKILDEYGLNLTSSTALGKYQRQRKHATWQMIALMEGLKRLFSTDSNPLISLRSFGLKACDRISPLKRFLIAEAMGNKR